MEVSDLVALIQRHFPGRDALIDPVVKLTDRGQRIEVWFDVRVYSAHGSITVLGVPSPRAAWEEIEQRADMKPPKLDAFDGVADLALRERRAV